MNVENLIKIVEKLTDCAYGLEYWNDGDNERLNEAVNKLYYIISLLHEIVDLQYLYDLIGENKEKRK